MSQRKSRWYWLAVLAFVALLAAYARYHDLPGLYAGYRHSEREVRALEQRLESLKAEEEELKHSVEGLKKKDSLAVEAAIRSGRGLVREGETVYRVELPEDSLR